MKNTLKKITAISSSIDFAFYRTRLSCLAALNLPITLAGFTSNVTYVPRDLSIPNKIYGTISVGKYWSRLWVFLKSAFPLRRELSSSDGVYVFGFDMMIFVLLLSSTMRRKPWMIYEVHDIRDALLRKDIVGKLLRWLDKKAVLTCSLLVVTSEVYIHEYYRKILGLKNVKYMVIENKLIRNDHPPTKPEMPPFKKEIRIGYFGVLRCPLSIDILSKTVTASNSKIRLILRGIPIGLSCFENQTLKNKQIEYEGPYNDPDDLHDIYKSVHLIWAAGKQSKQSYIWTKSCRFYNSLAFRRPIIAEQGTDDAEEVKKWNIGFVVNSGNIESTISRLLSLSEDEITSYYNNLAKIDEHKYWYGEEHRKIKNFMMRLNSHESA